MEPPPPPQPPTRGPQPLAQGPKPRRPGPAQPVAPPPPPQPPTRGPQPLAQGATTPSTGATTPSTGGIGPHRALPVLRSDWTSLSGKPSSVQAKQDHLSANTVWGTHQSPNKTTKPTASVRDLAGQDPASVLSHRALRATLELWSRHGRFGNMATERLLSRIRRSCPTKSSVDRLLAAGFLSQVQRTP